MHDFGCSKAADMFYMELAEQVKYYKETERGRKIMCKAVDDLAEKRAENRRIDNIADNLKKMVKNLQITLEQAMNTLELSEADRQAVEKRL